MMLKITDGLTKWRAWVIETLAGRCSAIRALPDVPAVPGTLDQPLAASSAAPLRVPS
jgi:hypothetical protein